MLIDSLIEKIIQTNNPSVIGIDTAFDYLPNDLKEKVTTLDEAAQAIRQFNYAVIDAVADIAPAVKVQVAYYEMYGVAGMQCFYDTLRYAKERGLFVVSDIKRNDIGSTAACYSTAYLGETRIGDQKFRAFPSDFVTVNGYLGSDGIQPFLQDCKAYDRGMFILVKTSNPSSDEFQDRAYAGGELLYEAMADKVTAWGSELVGSYGYSSVGAVVGATKPEQAKKIRERSPQLFFLVPGYGAQGGGAADIMNCFDHRGLGAIVNSSRGILCAYRQEKYAGMHFDSAARAAAIDMQRDITQTLKKFGKEIKRS